jgi:hypothetical protein
MLVLQKGDPERIAAFLPSRRRWGMKQVPAIMPCYCGGGSKKYAGWPKYPLELQ